MVGEGHSTKQIATLLHKSPKTVEFHKARLMETVGMHTVADLTRYAVSHGLLDI
ncbi:MAG: response regulator transcription factor [Nitrospira sp.]|nr:response regulator transcription factor [Nitrospira sp.]